MMDCTYQTIYISRVDVTIYSATEISQRAIRFPMYHHGPGRQESFQWLKVGVRSVSAKKNRSHTD